MEGMKQTSIPCAHIWKCHNEPHMHNYYTLTKTFLKISLRTPEYSAITVGSLCGLLSLIHPIKSRVPLPTKGLCFAHVGSFVYLYTSGELAFSSTPQPPQPFTFP
jgi:hypothetical protein